MTIKRKRKKLLVVTPTLGQSRYLDETVSSVRKINLELRHVLIGPPELENLQNKYPDILFICEKPTVKGMYSAINQAISECDWDWDYFTYINDDDYLIDGINQICLDIGSSPNDRIGMRYGDVLVVDQNEKTKYTLPVGPTPGCLMSMFKSGKVCIAQQGAVWSADAIRKLKLFDESYMFHADTDLFIRALLDGINIRYFNVKVGAFRHQPGQLSQTNAHRQKIESERWLALAQNFAKYNKGDYLRFYWHNMPRQIRRILHCGFKSSDLIMKA